MEGVGDHDRIEALRAVGQLGGVLDGKVEPGRMHAQMFFYVDSASVLAGKIGSGVRVLAEEPYYRHIPRTGLKLSTKISMAVSDRFCMVKLIRISL